MPIYEYRAIARGCAYCTQGFDILQKITDPPLNVCPKCGARIKKAVSTFRACAIEIPGEAESFSSQLAEYESEGKWSHAAELADQSGLEERAHDDYKKAGYNF